MDTAIADLQDSTQRLMATVSEFKDASAQAQRVVTGLVTMCNDYIDALEWGSEVKELFGNIDLNDISSDGEKELSRLATKSLGDYNAALLNMYKVCNRTPA